MPARSPARFLAPLALIAFFIALVVVVGGSGSGGNSDTGPNRVATRTAAPKPKRKPKKPRDYVIKQGDLLETIAQKTGVSVDRIQTLNPNLDPQTLVPGQRIKLTP
jgi:LysM repeat protein